MLKTLIKLPFKIVILPFKVIRPKYIVYLTGLYTLGYGLTDMSAASFMHNMRDKVNLRQRYGADTWVVISGATDPVGKEFAEQFSKQGFNIILLDSDENKLQELQKLLQQTGSDNSIKAIAWEFNKHNSWKDYEHLCNHIKEVTMGKDISVLINNAE